jgi:3-(3-hydroxy-phenyl)propionate hydroxylase
VIADSTGSAGQVYDVAVVGYGPTGLAVTSLLARLGHRVVALERYAGLYGLPRLVNLDAESARIVQASGDIDVALAESAGFDEYYYRNAAGEALLFLDWSGTDISGFASHLSMYQPNVEDAIDGAARKRGAEIRQSCEVIGVDQDQDGVTVTTRDRETGEEGTVRARWLIAADGANSRVREILGLEREDLQMGTAFLNLDMLRRSGCDVHRLGPTVTCAPPRMNVILPIGEERLRVEFEVVEGDDRDELVRPATAWRMLGEAFGLGPDDVEIYRQVIYEFESQLLHGWRHGRILLAGDAAHQMSPFVGQGACAALRDAIALSWRLDLILRDQAGDGLLDTYEVERKPHVRTHIETAAALGHIACEHDEERARQRDALFLSDEPPPPPPDPRLGDGILHLTPGGERGVLAGRLGPQGIVTKDGRTGRADDVLGWGFTVLARGRDPREPLTAAQEQFLEGLNCHFVPISREKGTTYVRDVEGTYADFFDQHGVEALLVRPDFVVFGAAESLDDLPGLVEDLRAQLESPVAA